MQNKWIIEMIGDMAFIQEPMKYLGYGIEKGIIIIADDDENAMRVKSMLVKYLDAVEVKPNNKKGQQICNYQMGVYRYDRTDDKKRVIDFLEAREYLPVVIVNGFVPESLIGRGYMFRCISKVQDFSSAGKAYKRFSDFVKRNKNEALNMMSKIGENEDSDDVNKISKYKEIGRMLETVVEIKTRMYAEIGISKEEINKKQEKFVKMISNVLEVMDNYECDYDISDFVKECFTRLVREGEIGLSIINEDMVEGSIENRILYDDNYYYVSDSTLRKICEPYLETVSLVQLKNEMNFSGMLECDKGKKNNFTKKKVIWNSYGWSERVRLLFIKKETFMAEDGMLLENIWEEKIC